MQPKQTANLDSFNFKGNPYMDMIQGAQTQQQPPQGQQGAPQGQGMGMGQGGMMREKGMNMGQGGMMGGKAVDMPENQLDYGSTGDASRDLVSAINSIENYIKRSTNRDQIALGRQLILMIGRLMQSDQTEQLDKLGNQGQQAQS